MNPREWTQWHSVYMHIAGPIWLRTPERHRWTIVHWLNRSQRRCWSDLVSDALCYPETDPCDRHIPALRGERMPRCATTCDWFYHDHSGAHDCACYCGKFQFRASGGARDRAGTAIPT